MKIYMLIGLKNKNQKLSENRQICGCLPYYDIFLIDVKCIVSNSNDISMKDYEILKLKSGWFIILVEEL